MVVLGAQDVQSENDIKGADRIAPGQYHVVIDAVDDSFSEVDNAILITVRALAGTVAGQENMRVVERFYVTEKSLLRLRRFALVTKVLLPGEPDKDIDFQATVGAQLIVKIIEDKYKDSDGNEKSKMTIDYLGMWSLENPETQNVPRDQASLVYNVVPAVQAVQQMAQAVPTGTQVVQQAAAPSQIQPPVQQPQVVQPPVQQSIQPPVQQSVQPMPQPVPQPVQQPVQQPMPQSPSVGQPVQQSMEPQNGQPIQQPVGQPVPPPNGQPVQQPQDWSKL